MGNLHPRKRIFSSPFYGTSHFTSKTFLMPEVPSPLSRLTGAAMISLVVPARLAKLAVRMKTSPAAGTTGAARTARTAVFAAAPATTTLLVAFGLGRKDCGPFADAYQLARLAGTIGYSQFTRLARRAAVSGNASLVATAPAVAARIIAAAAEILASRRLRPVCRRIGS